MTYMCSDATSGLDIRMYVLSGTTKIAKALPLCTHYRLLYLDMRCGWPYKASAYMTVSILAADSQPVNGDEYAHAFVNVLANVRDILESQRHIKPRQRGETKTSI